MNLIYKITLAVMLTAGNMFAIHSQTRKTQQKIYKLGIGDQCPDFEFTSLINHPTGKAKLSDFKGKLVLLDFWATWCMPCVQSFPKMDSFARKFENRFAVVPVTSQDSETVKEFLSTSKMVRGLKPTTITSDSVLRRYFPHTGIPHIVWIDGTGKVIAITDHLELTEQNLSDYLKYGILSVKTKYDVLNFSSNKPLLLGGLNGIEYKPEIVQKSSLITSYVEGLPAISGAITTKNKRSSKVLSTNGSVKGLYQSAYISQYDTVTGKIREEYYLDNRVIWEKEDSTLLWTRNSPKEKDYEKKLFCYELIMPFEDSALVGEFMLRDLNDFFGRKYNINGRMESRKVDCWVLYILDSARFKAQTKPGQVAKEGVFIDRNRDKITVQNKGVKDFLFYWGLFGIYHFTLPVVDETNYTGNMSFSFDAKPSDFFEVKEHLERLGLGLKQTERQLDMIVIGKVK